MLSVVLLYVTFCPFLLIIVIFFTFFLLSAVLSLSTSGDVVFRLSTSVRRLAVCPLVPVVIAVSWLLLTAVLLTSVVVFVVVVVCVCVRERESFEFLLISIWLFLIVYELCCCLSTSVDCCYVLSMRVPIIIALLSLNFHLHVVLQSVNFWYFFCVFLSSRMQNVPKMINFYFVYNITFVCINYYFLSSGHF